MSRPPHRIFRSHHEHGTALSGDTSKSIVPKCPACDTVTSHYGLDKRRCPRCKMISAITIRPGDKDKVNWTVHAKGA
jgi:phage FluMu protein Com